MNSDTRDRREGHPCEMLSALVDGELADGERGAVEEHLRACPACRDLVDDLGILRGAVAAEASPPVPADLAARIRARIEERPATRREAWWRMPWRTPMPAAAAAAVVVAALVWLAWPGGRPPGTAMPDGEVMAHRAPGSVGAPTPPPATPEPDTTPPVARPSATSPAPASPPAPGPGTGPAAPERTDAAARERVESKSRTLRALDADAGTSRRAPAPPPAAAGSAWGRTDTVAGRAAPSEEGASQDEAVDLARQRVQEGFKESEVAGARLATLAAAAAAPVSPPLAAAPYVVRLLPGATMSVRDGDYRCSIPVAPEDARLLADLGDAATAAGGEAADAAAKAIAADAPAAGTAAPAAAREPAKTAAQGSAAAPPAGTEAPAAEPAPALLPPQARQAVVRLVRERYRATIEERCGPLPH